MNETLEVIKRRRSIRKYKPEQIPDADLQAIMEAAIWAPSAINQQRWHFTVIQNKDLLNEITELAREVMKSGPEFFAKRAQDPNFSPFFHAPTVIVISGDAGARFIQLDCALAAQNILIAAESLGIGSCIMTSPEFFFSTEKGQALLKRLGVPEGYKHICTVTLGYMEGERPEPKPRRENTVTYLR
ncbi:MAG TPA: nitroreductase family protein [Firmicutes bacterium]|nr:nitroreductase family protein [Candidatus Fermentithermobacillaceae bacterium]